MSRCDANSYFDDSQPRARSLHLRLRVDAGRRLLEGEATLVFPGRGVEGPLDLDTQGLEVHSVYVTATAAPLPFELRAEEPGGRRLRLRLPRDTMGITIAYETAPGALDAPDEAIQARMFLPCQDCPQVPLAFTGELFLPEGPVPIALPKATPDVLLKELVAVLRGKRAPLEPRTMAR